MADQPSSTSIPFSFFVSLVEHIARIKPRKANVRGPKSHHSRSSVVQTFQNWVSELHRRYDPLPPGTTAIIFRLLFPEEDAKRKYDMQETRLAHAISKALCMSHTLHGRGQRLATWKAETAVGCLGHEVRKVLEDSEGAASQLSIEEVDALLSTLASRSAFSANSVRQDSASVSSLKSRPRSDVIRTLYSRLSASEACVVTQIILKDLRPLLYPLPEDEMHYTSLLMHYKSNAVEQLSKSDAMRIWDTSGRMLASYRVRALLDEAALVYEQGLCLNKPRESPLAPKIGTPIQIPKCSKGQGCAHTLRLLHGSDKVWAETKYDGERTQVHVDISSDCPRITIYSKSGRDSTMDRVAIHPIILDAIGYGTASCKVKRNIVLEAEMVAYSDALHRVDEFWRIRSLIGTTAVGPRSTRHPKQITTSSQDTVEGSQCSLFSNASDDGARHLALVFFDVLVLDGVSLLSSPYFSRRKTLEDLLHLKPGHVMLADRIAIDMRPDGHAVDPESRLRKVFAEIIADHQEGLVLKAHEAAYNDWRMPWVKLKKDYIEGYGDALDLVLVGASWEKDRARELRVAPTVYTTFYIGALANAQAVKADARCTPHFEVFFTASYGLSREELEQLNFRIKSSDFVRYEPGKTLHGVAYTYNVFKGLPPPAVLLPVPILAEVVGGSFTKATHSKFYELRFPRITKVYRSNERSWRDGATLDEFQRIAREAVGHESSHKDVEDWCNELWGKPSSPGVKCPLKRKRTEAEWEEKLEVADRRTGKKTRTSKASAEPRYRSHPDDSGDEENTGGPLPESLKSPRVTRALGSMTNLMSSSPVADDCGGASPSEPSVAVVSAKVTRLPSPPSIAHPPRRGQLLDRKETLTSPSSDYAPLSPPSPPRSDVGLRVHSKRMSASEPLIDDSNIVVDTHLVGLSHKAEGSSTTITGFTSTTTTDFASTPIGRFLRDAVVWLATPGNAPRPAWRVPSKLIFPTGQQVHSLESVFQACNWGTGRDVDVCDWAKKGVIFVDDTQGTSSKPIWVFSVTMLSYDILRGCCSLPAADAMVEDRALCRFG